MSEHVRNIAVDIVLTVITCGLYNLYWQAKQMTALNEILNEDKYSFLTWCALTLITCGLYHIYHEYRVSSDLAEALGRDPGSDKVIAVVLSLFGLSIVVDAIQQSQINEHFGDSAL
ncbi:MAG: DUF4234 domain-containing protein [Myxococcales bacterium]|nr:DUF4234 domain-containing protein [Myxococcales bacterium]MDD9964803.1 DUF4234 domain-containing protein [Myxococcales bacterium]